MMRFSVLRLLARYTLISLLLTQAVCGCLPIKGRSTRGAPATSQQAPPQPYRPVFSSINDFPQFPGAELLWRKVARSQYGPYVEAIYGCRASLAELDSFFQEALSMRGCELAPGSGYDGALNFSNYWRCVPGYEEDTRIFAGESERRGCQYTVQYMLNTERPGIINTDEPANRDSVTLIPIDDKFRIRKKK